MLNTKNASRVLFRLVSRRRSLTLPFQMLRMSVSVHLQILKNQLDLEYSPDSRSTFKAADVAIKEGKILNFNYL